MNTIHKLSAKLRMRTDDHKLIFGMIKDMETCREVHGCYIDIHLESDKKHFLCVEVHLQANKMKAIVELLSDIDSLCHRYGCNLVVHIDVQGDNWKEPKGRYCV